MFKKYLSLLVILAVFFISGCGKSLSGVYEQVPGDKGMVDVGLAIEFVSGEKAYMSVMGVKTEVKYSIDGKKIIITELYSDGSSTTNSYPLKQLK